jgi:hypothetical protein
MLIDAASDNHSATIREKTCGDRESKSSSPRYRPPHPTPIAAAGLTQIDALYVAQARQKHGEEHTEFATAIGWLAAPTSRDFVHWRFSNACRWRVGMGS